MAKKGSPHGASMSFVPSSQLSSEKPGSTFATQGIKPVKLILYIFVKITINTIGVLSRNRIKTTIDYIYSFVLHLKRHST